MSGVFPSDLSRTLQEHRTRIRNLERTAPRLAAGTGRYTLSQNVTSGATLPMPFVYSRGAQVLDLTTPTAPLLLEPGVYAITVTLGGNADWNASASLFVGITAFISPGGFLGEIGTSNYSTDVTGVGHKITQSSSLTWLATVEDLRLSVVGGNGDSVTRAIVGDATVTKIFAI